MTLNRCLRWVNFKFDSSFYMELTHSWLPIWVKVDWWTLIRLEIDVQDESILSLLCILHQIDPWLIVNLSLDWFEMDVEEASILGLLPHFTFNSPIIDIEFESNQWLDLGLTWNCCSRCVNLGSDSLFYMESTHNWLQIWVE